MIAGESGRGRGGVRKREVMESEGRLLGCGVEDMKTRNIILGIVVRRKIIGGRCAVESNDDRDDETRSRMFWILGSFIGNL
jgi:hypothetical protein